MFVAALIGTVFAATFLPCRGASAQVFGLLGSLSIGALFFLQGARLSRTAMIAGLTHWRLHLAIAGTTFLMFPVIGSTLIALFPRAMSQTLWLGVLFVCALPSTVQSSIALTSIARGNVAGAICAATASNLAGLVLVPILFGIMAHLHGGVLHMTGVSKILVGLLLPFITGHLMQPWIGSWTKRNRAVLAITDRGSILLVVYTAFSAAVVQGIWNQLAPVTFVTVCLIDAVLLITAVLVTRTVSRTLGFDHADEVAAVFCGSQKSLVSGIPMASVLFAGPTMGLVVLPIMIYHPMQLLVCAWLARRYTSATNAGLALSKAPIPGGSPDRARGSSDVEPIFR
jgi:sodium/bile acid cotransporter 7